MERASEALETALRRAELLERLFSDMDRPPETLEERMRRKEKEYNESEGNMHEKDGYKCKKCQNRGYFAKFYQGMGGMWYESYVECSCMESRRSIQRMKRSGLADFVKDCTFDKYEAKEEWQKAIKDAAQHFCAEEDKGKWFFVGGAVGCGKTHICTAICRHMLMSRGVRYMQWNTEIEKIKMALTDEYTHSQLVNELMNVDVLYIDDLYKPALGKDGMPVPPTPADIRQTFNILNHRYVRKLTTIISSEKYISELLEIDEAGASRIAERSRGYCITVGRDPAKNYRTQGGIFL